jgi:predicted DsbA family dithiol-disulfide isomerase
MICPRCGRGEKRMSKPIEKIFNNKDLNIAYAKGKSEAQEKLSQEQKQAIQEAINKAREEVLKDLAVEKNISFNLGKKEANSEEIEFLKSIQKQIISSGEKVYTDWLKQELSYRLNKLQDTKNG